VRIATWNVNSLTARMPRVVGWLEEHQPDILCMQETKQAENAFPLATFADLGYESVHCGDGRWNGVAIISRIGLTDPARGFGAPEDEYGCRFVAATCGGTRVHSIYVPNGRSLDSEHYQHKLAWLRRLGSYLAERLDPANAIAVCGDFNVAPTDADVWDPEAFVGATHTSDPERRALEGISEWGLEDIFRRFHPEGGIFSWWDYRAGDFHQGRGLRIDLVLLSQQLAARATSAIVDRDTRKGKKPSDHAPVVVDLADDS
jgi:exodeoxyribonuclease III